MADPEATFSAPASTLPVKTMPARKRRWRIRFSLRTLVLASLMIGSGTLLWWNWGPWAPTYSIEERGTNSICHARGGGRFIVSYLHPETKIREVCKGRNGAIELKLWPLPKMPTAMEISDAGEYVRIDDEIYEADSGKKTALPRANMGTSRFRGDDHWLTFLSRRQPAIWLRLPSLEEHIY